MVQNYSLHTPHHSTTQRNIKRQAWCIAFSLQFGATQDRAETMVRANTDFSALGAKPWNMFRVTNQGVATQATRQLLTRVNF